MSLQVFCGKCVPWIILNIKKGEMFMEAAVELSVKDPNAGDMIFATKAGEIIKICRDGRIYIKGNEIVDDKELVDGLKSWLAEMRLEVPEYIINQMEEIQRINKESTDTTDEYYRGMHNGMEALIACLGKREPKYMEKVVTKWTSDEVGVITDADARGN